MDAIALNEHHGNPFCMGNVMNVEAAILAHATKRAKIVLIGNPLPVIKHPLRMAEELATIDLHLPGTPGHRLGAGRGLASSSSTTPTPPTTGRCSRRPTTSSSRRGPVPGPWRYEGKHFHYRHVNPWALPYQKPHPPMWIPGVLSPETVAWCAEHALPVHRARHGTGADLRPVGHVRRLAAEHGYQAGPENFGYLIRPFVADTEEKAQELGKGFVFGAAARTRSQPARAHPATGLQLQGRHRRLAQAAGRHLARRQPREADATDHAPTGDRHESVRAKAEGAPQGPTNYLPDLRHAGHGHREAQDDAVGAAARHLHLLRTAGPVRNEDRMRSLELLAEYVVPEIKAYADEIGLASPFETKVGDVKLRNGEARGAVVDRAALPDLETT